MSPRLPIFALAFTIAPLLFAAVQKQTFIDPAEAGPDFAIQGDYTSESSAAQVIALGDGKFRIVGWRKGLPGAVADAEKVGEVEAVRTGEKATFDSEGWKGEITGEKLTGTNEEGKSYSLTKTERTSPTMGAKPPAGAIVLFDGKTADAWNGGKIDAHGFLQGGTKTREAFGDGSLHVEFRTPFQPAARGQGRGNSGVYLQDRYEVQVLDSYGLKGENNECGGIYGHHKPRVNMCFPPLSWQTYDIDFTAARYDDAGKKTKNATLTVKHNGVLIHENAEVPGGTTAAGAKEGPTTGPIQLQNHGNPVVYRNIWFVPKTQ